MWLGAPVIHLVTGREAGTWLVESERGHLTYQLGLLAKKVAVKFSGGAILLGEAEFTQENI